MSFLSRIARPLSAAAILALWSGAAAAQSFAQDFDSLPGTGASSGWSDNLTVAANSWTNNGSNSMTGFFATQTQGGIPASPALIRISNGSSGFGNSGLYSYGSTNNSERALGGFTGFQNGAAVTEVAYGFRYTNNTANAISSIKLDYRMEQWRASAAGAGGTQDQLLLETLSDPTSTLSFTSPGYVFRSTVLGLPPAAAGAALDGNLAGNFVTVSNTIAGLNIAPGQSIWVRWRDQLLSNAGANEDGGLSIDNLTFTVTQVPEPSAVALAAAGLGGLALLRRRRRLAA